MHSSGCGPDTRCVARRLPGDDDGHVRLWDVRTRARVATFRVHEDFVADMHVHRGRSALLTASGDGTLAHLDLRTQTVVARSDAQEDELLCGASLWFSTSHIRLGISDRIPLAHDPRVCGHLAETVTLVKGGSKVVCGSQEGVLSIFDLADIQDISDRFPGHPASVDTLVAVTEDMVLTGSSDGVIRVISILPNKMLGAFLSGRGRHTQPLLTRACTTQALWVSTQTGRWSGWPCLRMATRWPVRCVCPP